MISEDENWDENGEIIREREGGRESMQNKKNN